MNTDVPPSTSRPSTRTGLAFLLAPGAAAVAGAIAIGVLWGDGRPPNPGMFLLLVMAFAVVGYPTAMVFGVPVYLALTERARSAVAVVVPSAGAIAGAPWLVGTLAAKRHPADFSVAGTAFVLGCVAGVVFLLVRQPPDADDAEAGR